MGWIVLFGLIAWPILEIYVFVQVGDAIGWINTVLLFLGAGAVGLWLLRAEGLSLLVRAQAQMREGVAPVDEAFDALCLVAGGILLLVPGFLTDIAALILFLPPTRRAIKRLMARSIVQHRAEAQRRGGGVHSVIIEGEFEHVAPAEETPPKDPIRLPPNAGQNDR